MAAELKSCPFCGGDAELDTQQGHAQYPSNGRHGSRIAVYCRDCGADIGVCREDVPGIEPEQVVAMWQRRRALPDDLPTLVRRLVQALRKSAPDNELAEQALDYLRRHGLQGSPLRADVSGAPVSEAPSPDASEVARVLGYLASDEAQIRAAKVNVVWADTMARAADLIRALGVAPSQKGKS